LLTQTRDVHLASVLYHGERGHFSHGYMELPLLTGLCGASDLLAKHQ
jgi:hypothetical protein